MSQKVVISIVVILVIVVAGLLGWYFFKMQPENEKINNSVNTTNTVQVNRPPENTVYIIDGSFNPSVLDVAAGTKVTWVNKDSVKRVVASDPHPAHTDLPGLVSEELESGESYSFTFTTAGDWTYHDHLNPIKKGIVKVK